MISMIASRMFLTGTSTILAMLAVIAFITSFTAVAEFILYYTIFGSAFFVLFYRDPYRCLFFFIIWLPLQTFVLSVMAVSGHFSDQFIVFLASIKELALAMLIVGLLKRNLFFKGRLSRLDYLLIANVCLLVLYFLLPDSFFEVASDLKVKTFGLRSGLVTLLIYAVGRYVPYDPMRVRTAIRMLCSVCVLVTAFGFIEFLFIPRDTLMAGFVPYGILKGEDPVSLRNPDFLYIVEYSGFTFKRMMSFFLSPLSLAYFLIFPLTLVMVERARRASREAGIVQYSVLVLTFISVSIIFSGTRAVIAVGVFLAAVVFSARRALTAGILLTAITLLLIISPYVSLVTDTLSLQDPSSQAHALAYTLGVESLIRNPLGIGLGQAGPTAVLVKGSTGLYGGEDDGSIGESLYLTIAMQRGLPGLAIFLIFVVCIAIAAREVGGKSPEGQSALMGRAVFFGTIAFLIASIPTEHWLGFQSAAIYWWFAGLVVQRRTL